VCVCVCALCVCVCVWVYDCVCACVHVLCACVYVCVCMCVCLLLKEVEGVRMCVCAYVCVFCVRVCEYMVVIRSDLILIWKTKRGEKRFTINPVCVLCVCLRACVCVRMCVCVSVCSCVCIVNFWLVLFFSKYDVLIVHTRLVMVRYTKTSLQMISQKWLLVMIFLHMPQIGMNWLRVCLSRKVRRLTYSTRHATTPCNALQHNAVQHTATHCSTLKHTAADTHILHRTGEELEETDCYDSSVTNILCISHEHIIRLTDEQYIRDR